MTREQAKELLPIIQAFAEGKTIQYYYGDGKWMDIEVAVFNEDTSKYRIKSEPKYRPFKDAKECLEEMQKHQPVGWTKLKKKTEYSLITNIDDAMNYSAAIKEYTFADGTPFGIKK